MSIGSRHRESGLLLHSGSGLILRRDDGGRWRIDAPRMAGRLVGQRVTLEAIRSGFDLLDVKAIYPEGKPPPKPYIASWQFAAGVLTTLVAVIAAIITIGAQS